MGRYVTQGGRCVTRVGQVKLLPGDRPREMAVESVWWCRSPTIFLTCPSEWGNLPQREGMTCPKRLVIGLFAGEMHRNFAGKCIGISRGEFGISRKNAYVCGMKWLSIS